MTLINLIQSFSGFKGFKIVTSANSPLAGRFFTLVPDGDLEFSAVSRIGDALPAATRQEGIPINGDFTSVSVTSGRVRAYPVNV